MKNKLLISVLILFFSVAMLFSSCSHTAHNQGSTNQDSVETVTDEKSQLTADQIKKDLASKELSGLNSHDLLNVEGFNYHIKDVTIDRAQIDEFSDSATYWCTAVLENQMYIAEASISATYAFYEIGGWQLETFSPCSDVKYTPRAGVPEAVVRNDLFSSAWAEGLNEDNVSTSQFENTTDLKNGSDSVSFMYTETNSILSFSGKMQLKYSFDIEYGWILDSISIDLLNYSINEQGYECSFYTNCYGALHYFVFDNLSGSPVSFTEYTFPNFSSNNAKSTLFHAMRTDSSNVVLRGSEETAPYLYIPETSIKVSRNAIEVYPPNDKYKYKLKRTNREYFNKIIANSRLTTEDISV